MVIVNLTGTRSGSLASFNSGMIPPSPAVRPEHEILLDDHTERPAWPNGDRGLDIKVFLDQTLARFVGALLG
jgi:hypothetical protein